MFALAVSPDGRWAASGGVDEVIYLWSLDRPGERRILPGHLAPVWSLAFTPDSEQLVSGGADEVARRWDLATGEELGTSVTAGLSGDLGLNDPNASRGAVVFRKCAVCHSVTADSAHRAGPNLHGVFGREAGTVDGYKFSQTLIDSEIVWTKQTIAELFELGPDIMTPGTKMPIQRIPDAGDRQALVDYLAKIVGAEEEEN